MSTWDLTRYNEQGKHRYIVWGKKYKGGKKRVAVGQRLRNRCGRTHIQQWLKQLLLVIPKLPYATSFWVREWETSSGLRGQRPEQNVKKKKKTALPGTYDLLSFACCLYTDFNLPNIFKNFRLEWRRRSWCQNKFPESIVCTFLILLETPGEGQVLKLPRLVYKWQHSAFQSGFFWTLVADLTLTEKPFLLGWNINVWKSG